jgi:hypothetical protein
MDRHAAWILPAVTALAGCTGISSRESAADQYQRYMDYAGAPIESFSVLGQIHGWQSLGRHALVVWTGVNQAYLLRVAPQCASELSHAMGIGLTSTVGSVHRGFDAIRVGRYDCTITEIRPVDYRQLRADRRAERGE